MYSLLPKTTISEGPYTMQRDLWILAPAAAKDKHEWLHDVDSKPTEYESMCLQIPLSLTPWTSTLSGESLETSLIFLSCI